MSRRLRSGRGVSSKNEGPNATRDGCGRNAPARRARACNMAAHRRASDTAYKPCTFQMLRFARRKCLEDSRQAHSVRCESKLNSSYVFHTPPFCRVEDGSDAYDERAYHRIVRPQNTISARVQIPAVDSRLRGNGRYARVWIPAQAGMTRDGGMGHGLHGGTEYGGTRMENGT